MKKTLLLVLFVMSAVCSFAATTHVITTGDTLWALSAKHYGDPTLYPILLKVNNITNPRTILNGTVIYIPDISDMQTIANETDSEAQQRLIEQVRSGNSAASTSTSTSSETEEKITIDPSTVTFESILDKEIPADSLKSVDTPKNK